MRTICVGLILLSPLSALVLAEDAPAVLEKKIALPQVAGRIDHLALDLKTNRLFIAALGNNTIEVVELDKGARIQTLTGFSEPQGIWFLDEARQLVVASGGDGSCRIYNGDTLKLEKTIDLHSDADNVRYAPSAGMIYVGHGAGAIACLNAQTHALSADIKLSAHPESFQVDSAAQRIYVNVPDSKQIEVIDLAAGAVINKWKLKDAHANFPLALDAAAGRLYAGCRQPARLLVIDTQSGKTIQTLETVTDADDIFCDAARQRVMVIGGGGAVDFFSAPPAGNVARIASAKTRSGARTGLFSPTQSRLYVAARKTDAGDAELYVFTLK